MTDKTDSKEREAQAAETWLRDRYGAYRGHFAWREIEEAFLAGRASLTVSAGSGPLIGQPQEMPDLSALTERGAKAWAGVDAQGLREGAASAGSEPVAWIWKYANGEEEVVFVRPERVKDMHPDTHDMPSKITPLYLHPSPPEGMVAKQALRKVLSVVQRYLHPDGPTAHDAMTEITEIVDQWPLGPLEKP